MNSIFKQVFCVLISATLHLSLIAQPVISNEKIRILDSISVQDVPLGAPGIATAIIIDGHLIYQKVAGYENLEDSSFITPTSRFNIASNGKQFTAISILLLIEENKLKLSDDIRKFFPDLFRNISQPITIEQLLTHTSGIRDVYDLLSMEGLTWWQNTFDNSSVMSYLARQQDLNFLPGTSYLYSNSNYILLAQVVEKVSNQSFFDFTNHLFQRLGMLDTRFEPDYKSIKPPVSKAYFNFNTWTTFKWIWNVCGDGNLFSTLKDQVIWERIIQGGVECAVPLEIIHKSQELINPGLNSKYGYGLEFGLYKGKDYKFHEGATGAWKATTIRFSESKISIVTLTNTGKSIPYNQTRQMADAILDLQNNPATYLTKPDKAGDSVNIKDIIGIYLTEDDFAFEFLWKENDLYLRRDGRNDVILERESGNIFRQTFDKDFKQEFTRNTKGELQVTAYYPTHAPYSLTKISTDWKRFDFKSISGNYNNKETNTDLQLQYKEKNLYEVKLGKRKNPMNGILITTGKMLVGGYTIVFKRNNSSIGILLSGSRIKMVKFERK